MIAQHITFDWRRFCERHRIDFVTSGPNTAKGNISIHCPWCGTSDPSHHLGLSLNKKQPYFGCLRNAKHRGRNPAYLISRLINVSDKEAFAIVNANASSVDDFEAAVEQLRNGRQEEEIPLRKAITFPPTFRLFEEKSIYEKEFRLYMLQRGFPVDILQRYKLMWAITGEQAFRVIFPVLDGLDLIGWTGRAIRPSSIRYKAFDAMGKDVLMTFPTLPKAKIIVICEGPVDALKIDYAGRQFGIAAVATMGTAITNEQIRRINQLATQPSIKKAVLLFDAEARQQSFGLLGSLNITSNKVMLGTLPAGYKDPGELPLDVATAYCKNILIDT